jgi:UPF0755 protein
MLLFVFLACEMMTDQLGAPAEPNNTSKIIFEVPKGTSARTLGKKLVAVNVIDSADNFTNYVRITKEGGCIKAGRFSLSRAMSAQQIIETLCGVPLHNDKPFTVVEGWRIREIDAALVKEGWIKPGEYSKLAASPEQFKAPFDLPKDTLEGYLFPQTYMLSTDNFETKQFIQRQIDLLVSDFYIPYKGDIAKSKRSFPELIIMGSMLEREEPKQKNRPMVAGILWKRIDNNWKLGVDATSRYTLDEWNDRKAFLKKLRDPNDVYNTRLRSGLPPTAIGNPSSSSLKAALKPVDSPYWYYLHDSSQNLHPAKDLKGHEANRRKHNVY